MTEKEQQQQEEEEEEQHKKKDGGLYGAEHEGTWYSIRGEHSKAVGVLSGRA